MSKLNTPGYLLQDTSSPCYFCKYRIDNKKHDGEVCLIHTSLSLGNEIPIDELKDGVCDDIEFSEEWQELIDNTDGDFQAFNVKPNHWAVIANI